MNSELPITNEPLKSMYEQDSYCFRNMSDPSIVIEQLTNTWKTINLFLLNTYLKRSTLFMMDLYPVRLYWGGAGGGGVGV